MNAAPRALNCGEQLLRVREVAAPVQDILEQRVDDARVPAWCETRGWTSYLLALDDTQLKHAEAHGLAAILTSDAPRDLLALARDIAAVTTLPRVAGSTPLGQEALRNVRLRKRAQLSGLLSAVAPMAEAAQRIVDVGAGSGHFTRLSADLFQRQAVGLERNPERVAAAQRRSGGELTTFVAVDARDGLRFTPHDLAIGLHACGELGDRLVQAAAFAQCDLSLVSCCLQKISAATRVPLAQGLPLRREHLGLTNLTAQPRGVESSIDVTIAARQTRYALGLLLRARGLDIPPGAEMSGINRRQASAGLSVVAAKALALRELPPASGAEVAQHLAVAAQHYSLIRRLSLPRSMLSRLVEVLVSLDRAAHLEAHGLHSAVVTLFSRAVSPRNIGIFASRDRARLPAA